MASPLLSLRSLFKSRGSEQELHGIDLDVYAGEFLALLGPVGCGNSAIIQVIAGYALPDRGQIVLNGNDITRLPAGERSIGIVLPDVSNQRKTVSRYITSGLGRVGRGNRKGESRANELMELTGLSASASRRYCDLPGAQQLATAIAHAAAPQPDVILMDEPFKMLDFEQRRLMTGTIRQLQHKIGTTFVFSTQNAEDALAIADRIVLMRDGRGLQIDTPQALYNQPQTEFAANYLGCINLLNGSVTATGNGRALLNVSGLTLPCESGEPVALDQKMTLCLYAERLHVGLNQHGDIHLSGIVRENHFEGRMSRTVLELTTGQQLISLRPSEEANEFLPGQRVFLWWDIKNAVLVDGGP